MARYFHGGPQGLTKILPPSVTGVPSTADFGAQAVCRRDRVYVSTLQQAAEIFAAYAPIKGAVCVYEVEPDDVPVPDPDCDCDGLSFECSSATVIHVHREISQTARRKLLERISTSG